MEIVKEEFNVLSSDNKHTLKGVIYVPDCEIKGFYHVVHGMAEHIDRYDSFMRIMAEEGYICFGYNHLGHKGTAENKKELGFIANKNGWEYLIKDVKVFSDAVRDKFDEQRKLPYILMGHSMGSFIVRLASTRCVKPDKLIIMGTGGPNPMANLGLFIISVVKLCFGGVHVSPMVNNLAFGSFNKTFTKVDKTDESPWLTSNDMERQKYYNDEFCGFPFKVSAMGDLIRLMKYANQKAWFIRMAKVCPILLVSGSNDPVGNYGKGVDKVYLNLKKNGADVKEILYHSSRHEILNDTAREKTINDIKTFLR